MLFRSIPEDIDTIRGILIHQHDAGILTKLKVAILFTIFNTRSLPENGISPSWALRYHNLKIVPTAVIRRTESGNASNGAIPRTDQKKRFW